MQIGIEEGNFLNEEQKIIKSDIIHELLNIFNESLRIHNDKFDNQTFMDLIVAVLVIFNREIITKVIRSSNMVEMGDKIMDNIFNIIKEQVLNRLNNGL